MFDARKLARRRLERNKYGIDVFACVNCNERIKIDPHEYAGVSEMMARGETPRGVAIEAYKDDQLMPCEKEVQKEAGRFPSAPMTRRMKYRLAERTLRYPVYIAIEWLWAVVALIGMTNEFRPTGADWLLVAALAMLSIAHSFKMTTLHPWLTLKSILLGVVAFGLLAVSRHYFRLSNKPDGDCSNCLLRPLSVGRRTNGQPRKRTTRDSKYK